ncbi:MAG: hypothetical protein COU27_02750 [Candidatus Levybacteria bacterium CG10_big_fil_rev_8_21_14_0_10_36_7]|nr:MAG: hypothetical protein COU27_02750 [Candidatus Levybacteria bacterium CG10_big_fil_rev_8_21_14_0_10_36_7]
MKAVIFDMDGVIIDSEIHWNELFGAFLKKHISEWKNNSVLTGMGGREVHRYLENNHSYALSLNDTLKAIDIIADEIYSVRAQLFPDIRDVLTKLKGQYILGLASASNLKHIENVLEKHDLKHFFTVYISGQKVNKSKPSPDVFLETARRLFVDPKNCLVIEDSDYGIMAAKAAGMKCIGFKNHGNSRQSLLQADAVINKLTDFKHEFIDTFLDRNN